MAKRTPPPPSPAERPPRRWKQDRSAATHEALVRAARDVFAEKGFEGAQTPDIAATAGVSTGAFYRYFGDKKQIFLEVLTEHLQEARALIHKRLSPDRFVGADTRTAVDVVLDVLFEVIKRDALLNKVFLATSLSDPDVAALRAEFENEERRRIAALIRATVPRAVVPNPDAAAFVVQASAVEVAVARSGLRSDPGIDDREIKRALGDMLYRYLFGEAAAPGRKRAQKLGQKG